MSYEKALSAAGATVMTVEYFGDYQGTWLAKVEYNGQTGWVHDYFGSCSGCDAYAALMSEYTEPYERNGKYYAQCHEVTKEVFDKAKADYDKILSDFGSTYLRSLLTQEEVENMVSKNAGWDCSADEVINWVKANAI